MPSPTTFLQQHGASPKGAKEHSLQRKTKSQQQPIQTQREDELLPANIMFDRRVVRGNTYATRLVPGEPGFGVGVRSGMLGGSSGGGSNIRRTSVRPRAVTTPEPMEGRRHLDVQTDAYLEQLTDVIPEADTMTQTDAFIERPPTPQFVPAKTGTDATTQIEQGELFDFDVEVEPLLEVLVGRVLEQALMEVVEEEELAALREHQAHFEALRASELVAAQRLEAAERRKLEEKERRMKQERERRERERVVRAKVAACAFSRGYLNGIMRSVLQGLEQQGFFQDPVQLEVEQVFMPWLTQQAIAHLERSALAHAVTTSIIADAVTLRREATMQCAALADVQAAASAAHAAREADQAAQVASATLASISTKASLILTGLQPPLVRREQVEAVRAELTAQAASEAEAMVEAQRNRAAEERRAELAQAAAAAEEEGEGDAGGADATEVDVEAEAQAAAAAVQRMPPSDVTDGDVLGALMEQGVVTKDGIVRALALHRLTGSVKVRDDDAA